MFFKNNYLTEKTTPGKDRKAAFKRKTANGDAALHIDDGVDIEIE